MNLLAIHQRNLAQFLEQRELQGGTAHVAPAVANGILEARKNIARLHTIVRNGCGFTFDLIPGVDVEAAPTFTQPRQQVPPNPNRVGQPLAIRIGDQQYIGQCIYDQQGKTTIEWPHDDAVTFAVSGPSGYFREAR